MYQSALGWTQFTQFDPTMVEYASFLNVDPVLLANIFIEMKKRGYDFDSIPWAATDPYDAAAAAYLFGAGTVVTLTKTLETIVSDKSIVVGVAKTCEDYRTSSQYRDKIGSLIAYRPACMGNGGSCYCAAERSEYALDYTRVPFAEHFLSWSIGVTTMTRKLVVNPSTGETTIDWSSIRFWTKVPDDFEGGRILTEMGIPEPPMWSTPYEKETWRRYRRLVGSLVSLGSAVQYAKTQSDASPNTRVSVINASGLVLRRPTAISGDQAPAQICYPTPAGIVCITPTTKPPPGFPTVQAKSSILTDVRYDTDQLPLFEVQEASVQPFPAAAVGVTMLAAAAFYMFVRGVSR